MSDVAHIPLTRGRYAIVDAEDFEQLSRYTWHVGGRQPCEYARTKIRENGKQRHILMHRMILGLMDPEQRVDHANGNGLDNRKINLRMATHTQNMRNRQKRRALTSRFKGVNRKMDRRKKTNGRWRARIKVDGERIELGSFATELEAALAYDEAARQFHGEFARTNFV